MLRPVDLRLVVVRIRDSLSYHNVVDIRDMLLESCHRRDRSPPRAIKLSDGEQLGRAVGYVVTIRLTPGTAAVSVS